MKSAVAKGIASQRRHSVAVRWIYKSANLSSRLNLTSTKLCIQFCFLFANPCANKSKNMGYVVYIQTNQIGSHWFWLWHPKLLIKQLLYSITFFRALFLPSLYLHVHIIDYSCVGLCDFFLLNCDLHLQFKTIAFSYWLQNWASMWLWKHTKMCHTFCLLIFELNKMKIRLNNHRQTGALY